MSDWPHNTPDFAGESIVRPEVERPSRRLLEQLSYQELEMLTSECLSLLAPGRQALEVFKQAVRLFVQPILELVPFKPNPDDLPDILLTRRKYNDLWWPGQWSLPGAVLLPVDEIGIRDFEVPAARIIEDDFKGGVRLTSDVTQFDTQWRVSARGTELAAICWAEVDFVPGYRPLEDVRLFDVEKILGSTPEGGIVDGHRENIQNALQVYQVYQARKS